MNLVRCDSCGKVVGDRVGVIDVQLYMKELNPKSEFCYSKRGKVEGDHSELCLPCFRVLKRAACGAAKRLGPKAARNSEVIAAQLKRVGR